MHLVILGFNYKNTPIALREALAFDRDRSVEIGAMLKGQEVIEECMVLSTCNRTEVYCAGSCVEGMKETLYHVISDATKCELNLIKEISYFYEEIGTLKHMFRVAASLDAMVVGEAQVLGQFKAAYQTAVESGTVGAYLHKACHAAFRVAKKIRTETEIATLPISVGTLAAEMAEKSFGTLNNADVLIIGAGEMGTLCANHLKERGVSHIWIANRSHDAAEHLARSINGIAVPFESWSTHLQTADIVITSIGGGKLIEKHHVEAALAERADKPLVLIDLAVPRNIDESANGLSGLKLYNIDDLQGLAEKNLAARQEAARHAEKIVVEEGQTALDDLKQIKLAPLLSDLQKKWREIIDNELQRLYSKTPTLSGESKDAVRICTEGIVKKILHDPIRLAKEELARPGTNGKEITAALQKIFQINI